MTDKRLAANRANAAKSTGPRTPEGKARSAQNAVKHAFTSSHFNVVRAEDLDEVARLKADFVATWQPANAHELIALERAAIAQQAIFRAARLEAGLFTCFLNDAVSRFGTDFRPMTEDMVGDIDVTKAQNRNYGMADGFQRLANPQGFGLFLRYQAQAERLYRRAIEEFERVRKRRAELPNEPIAADEPEAPQPLMPRETNPPATLEDEVGQALGLPETSEPALTGQASQTPAPAPSPCPASDAERSEPHDPWPPAPSPRPRERCERSEPSDRGGAANRRQRRTRTARVVHGHPRARQERRFAAGGPCRRIDGPESVWPTLCLGAEPVGHGIAGARHPDLLRHVQERDIPPEICITSNLVRGGVEAPPHPPDLPCRRAHRAQHRRPRQEGRLADTFPGSCARPKPSRYNNACTQSRSQAARRREYVRSGSF